MAPLPLDDATSNAAAGSQLVGPSGDNFAVATTTVSMAREQAVEGEELNMIMDSSVEGQDDNGADGAQVRRSKPGKRLKLGRFMSSRSLSSFSTVDGETTSGSSSPVSSNSTTLGRARARFGIGKRKTGFHRSLSSLSFNTTPQSPSRASLEPSGNSTLSLTALGILPASASSTLQPQNHDALSEAENRIATTTERRPGSRGRARAMSFIRGLSLATGAAHPKSSAIVTSRLPIEVLVDMNDGAVVDRLEHDDGGDEPARGRNDRKGKGRAKLIHLHDDTADGSAVEDGHGIEIVPGCDRPARARSQSAPLLQSRLRSSHSPSPSSPSSSASSSNRNSFVTATSPSSRASFVSVFGDDSVEEVDDSHKATLTLSTLPPEIQLRVLHALVESCLMKERAMKKRDDERLDDRWVGLREGAREVVKMSRVSRTWRSLALDGQLWSRISVSDHLGGADVVNAMQVLGIARFAGQFVRELEMRNLAGLDDGLLFDFECALVGGEIEGMTNLTKLDLSGCSALSTPRLDMFISRCPSLTSLDLLAHPAVTTSTIDALSSCNSLVRLNVSRCPHLVATPLARLPPSVRHLHAASLPSFSDGALVGLFARCPELESLDVSYNRQLTDASWRAIVLNPKRIGLSDDDTSDATATAKALLAYVKSHPIVRSALGDYELGLQRPTTQPLAIRHLKLTHCIGLTDASLGHLGPHVPQLESLELAHMNTVGFRSAGLVKLLSTAGKLEKLDLEHGIGLDDSVLYALCDRTNAIRANQRVLDSSTASPTLTHLVISSCEHFTAPAIAHIIEGCTALRVLEADGTAVDDAAAKAFVERARLRAVNASSSHGQLSNATVSIAAMHEEALNSPALTDTSALSMLDARSVSRQTQKQLTLLAHTRPRHGQRGFWTTQEEGALGLGYHHGSGAPGQLDECDSSKTVVRSFFGHLTVDVADDARRRRNEAKAGKAGVSGITRALLASRSRALSESAIAGRSRAGEGGGSCIVS